MNRHAHKKPSARRILKKVMGVIGMRSLRTLVFLVLVLAVLTPAMQILLPRLLDINEHRPEIVSTLEWLTGRKITIESIHLSLTRGIAVECQNVQIFENDGQSIFAKTEKAYLVLRLLPLLQKDIVVNKIVLKGPQFTLHRDSEGRLNIRSLIATLTERLKEPGGNQTAGLNFKYIEGLLLFIHEGQGDWIDEKIIKNHKETFKLRHVNLLIPRFSMNEKIPFRLSLEVPRDPTPCYVELKGTILDLPQDLDLKNIFVDVQARLRSGDMAFLLPYYRAHLPYRNLKGTYTFKGQYIGNLLGDFKLNGSVMIDHLTLNYPKVFKKPITIDHGEVSFALRHNPQIFELSRLEMQIEDIHATGKGSIVHLDDPEEAEVHFDFASERIPILTGQKFVPVNAIPNDLPEFEEFFVRDMLGGAAVDVQAHMRGKVKDWTPSGFKKNLDLLSFSAGVDHIAVDVHSNVEPLVFKGGTVTLERGTMSFLDMSASWAESSLHQGFGTITNLYNDDGLLKLWVDADLDWRHAAAVLSYDIFDILPKMNRLKGKGILQTRLDISVPLDKPRNFALNGSIAGSNISFASPLKTLQFSGISSKMEFKGQEIHLPPTSCFLGESPLIIEIHFSDYYRPHVEAAVRGSEFNFEDLLGKANLDSFGKDTAASAAAKPEDTVPSDGGGSVENWTLNGTVALDKAHFKAFEFSNLNSKVHLQNGHIQLPGLHFNAYGGRYQGFFTDIDVTAKNRGAFSANFQYKDFDLAGFLQGVRSQQYRATGTGNLSGQLSSSLANKKLLASHMQGTLRFDAAHGTIDGMKGVANAFRILNLRLIGPKMQTFAFQWARAQFAFQNGVMSSKDIFIHGNIGSVSGVGSVDLTTRQVDGYMGVHTFEGVDKVLSAIPVLGTMVGGPDRKLMTTYFEVKGPLDNPKVAVTPLHSLRGGIGNFLKYFK